MKNILHNSPMKQAQLTMDPFYNMPWFVLRDILSRLVDLPTLCRLYTASPAIYTFLFTDEGSFVAIIEDILYQDAPECGIWPRTRCLLRYWVHLKWRQNSGVCSGNQFPGSYRELICDLKRVADNIRRIPKDLDLPLPNGIPSSVLFRLPNLCLRIHQVAHACFHDMVSKCLNLRPQIPKGPRSTWSLSPRPSGQVVIPEDLGPPSWLEEHRLIRAIWCIILYIEIRNMLIWQNSFLTIDEYDLQQFRVVQPAQFYRTIVQLDDSKSYVTETVFDWISDKAMSLVDVETLLGGLNSTMPERLETCCPELRSRIEGDESDYYDHSPAMQAPGWVIAKRIGTLPGSRLNRVEIFPHFRPLGLAIWDSCRLIAFGLMVTEHEKKYNYGLLNVIRCDHEFIWASILSNEQMVEMTGQASCG